MPQGEGWFSRLVKGRPEPGDDGDDPAVLGPAHEHATLDEVRGVNARLESELGRMHSRIRELEGQLEERPSTQPLHVRIAQLSTELRASETAGATARRAADEAQQAAQASHAHVLQLKDTLRTTAAQLSAKQLRLTRDRALREQTEAELASRTARVRDLSRSLSEMESCLTEAGQTQATLEGQIAQLLQDNTTMREQLERTKAQASELRGRHTKTLEHIFGPGSVDLVEAITASSDSADS